MPTRREWCSLPLSTARKGARAARQYKKVWSPSMLLVTNLLAAGIRVYCSLYSLYFSITIPFQYAWRLPSSSGRHSGVAEAKLYRPSNQRKRIARRHYNIHHPGNCFCSCSSMGAIQVSTSIRSRRCDAGPVHSRRLSCHSVNRCSGT